MKFKYLIALHFSRLSWCWHSILTVIKQNEIYRSEYMRPFCVSFHAHTYTDKHARSHAHIRADNFSMKFVHSIADDKHFVFVIRTPCDWSAYRVAVVCLYVACSNQTYTWTHARTERERESEKRMSFIHSTAFATGKNHWQLLQRLYDVCAVKSVYIQYTSFVSKRTRMHDTNAYTLTFNQ